MDDKFSHISSEIDKLRTSFLTANPDATEEDQVLYSFYLDDFSLHLKLKQISDERQIEDGDLSDIERFFPKGLTPQESKWLKMTLGSDFVGRNVLLEELSHAEVFREDGGITYSLFFVYDYPHEELGGGFHQAAIMRSRQEAFPVMRAQVFVAHGRPVITQLFITQGNVGEFDLEKTPLGDDCSFEAYSFSVEAVEAIQELYRKGIYTSASGQLDFSGAIAIADGRRAVKTVHIEGLMREAIPEISLSIEIDPMPLATQFSINLGDDGKWNYVAEIHCSLISDFYYAQIRRFNNEDGLYDELFHQDQYPNSWILQRIRDILFANGCKPMSNLRRNTHAWFGNRLVDATFGDCLFTAKIGREIS